MNRKFSSFDLSDCFIYFTFGIAVILIISAPLISVGKIVTTQQALNQECKTHYSFLQVALAGDNLARLCQIKNQTVTVK